MQEKIITYETAKLAKEKGFDWEVDRGYFSNKVLSNSWVAIQIELSSQILKRKNNKKITVIGKAPTQALLQKWLRELHLLHIIINPSFGYIICELNEISGGRKKILEMDTNNNYTSYEEALEIGLQEALKLI